MSIYKKLLRFTFLMGIVFLINACTLFKKKRGNKVGNQAVSIARGFIGTPYRNGGNSSSGIDCSGLIFQSYQPLGIKMPRISWQQAETGKEIAIKEAVVGDLIFFITSKKSAPSPINHAGIISEVSKNELLFIHASSSKGVREDNLYTDYWLKAFVKIMRPF